MTEIPNEVINKIHPYLMSRPMGEVRQMVTDLEQAVALSKIPQTPMQIPEKIEDSSEVLESD